MKQLAQRVLHPLASPNTPGAWYAGLRLMSLECSCLDVADEKSNAEFFGYPSSSKGLTAFPQARAIGIVECGTHAVVAAEIAPYKVSERALATAALPAWLQSDMLLIADRRFYGFKLWKAAAATGASLLWRVCSTLDLPVYKELSDGSYLSLVFEGSDQVRNFGQTVRVIEYTLFQDTGETSGSECYRLITTLMDESQAPGQELAALYHERSEVVNIFDEIKTHLSGASSTILRSKTQDLVQQEFWGLLMAHFAVRKIMAEAAWHHEEPPDHLSFMNAVRVLNRKMPQASVSPPP